jgi:hypothetical protein
MPSYRNSTENLTHISEPLLAEKVIIVITGRIELYVNHAYVQDNISLSCNI